MSEVAVLPELTYGELFAGYGGLGMGIQSVIGGKMIWCSEWDKPPSKILAYNWPGVPNLGDITKIDWTQVPRVDVLTGGSPCQDLSVAGHRKGMKAGTRSGLWASMCDAIEILKPSLVVWENVRGALSAEANSEVEPCSFCVGDESGPSLRALGRVLGDLAELGYDAWWCGLRASDVGAPHDRFRIFVFAQPAGTSWSEASVAAHANYARRGEHRRPSAVRAGDDSVERGGDDVGRKPASRKASRGRAPAEYRGRGASAEVADTSSVGHGHSTDGIGLGTALTSPGSDGTPVPGAGGSAANSGGERHGSGQDGGVVGRVDGEVEEGRRRPREVSGPGDAQADADTEGGRSGACEGHAHGAGQSSVVGSVAPGDGEAVSNTDCAGCEACDGSGCEQGQGSVVGGAEVATNSDVASSGPRHAGPAEEDGRPASDGAERCGETSTDTGSLGRERQAEVGEVAGERPGIDGEDAADSDDNQPRDEIREPVERAVAAGSSQISWGPYEPAIRRWEQVLGRVAPAPTEVIRGKARLSPRFDEWMMGLPDGHLTDPAIGISVNSQIKACGNGVCPQQAAEATRRWIGRVVQDRIAIEESLELETIG